MDLYPSKEHQIKFIKVYLETDDEMKIEEMLKEVSAGFAVNIKNLLIFFIKVMQFILGNLGYISTSKFKN